MNSAAFDPTDTALLLQRFEHDPKSQDPPRLPWSWAALGPDEAAALARLVDVYVASYNHTLATAVSEIVPPCWRKHPALAQELAVQVWLYYTAHHHPQATPAAAAEFYGRHLPGFRARVATLLGRSPIECRQGHHPPSWRKELDEQLAEYEQRAEDEQDATDLDRLGDLHFGFPAAGNA